MHISRMKTAVPAIALLLATSGPVNATTVSAGSLEITTRDGATQVANLVLTTLVDALSGSRGAAAVAVVSSDRDEVAASCPGWNCDTDAFPVRGRIPDVAVSDSKGEAAARARNNPPGGAPRGAAASAGGEIAAARAVITWRGKIKAEAAGIPVPVTARTDAAGLVSAPLPDPSDVVSAVATLDYAIQDLDLSAVTGDPGLGRISLWHGWNDVTSLEGDADFGFGNTVASLSGAFGGLSSQFTVSPFDVSTTGLTVSDSVTFQIDYGSFFVGNSFEAEFAGRAEAEAAVVPLPLSLVILGGGLLGLLYIGRTPLS